MARRRAESPKVRRWNGIVASADDLDERRVWVVWGLAAPPEIAAVPEGRYPQGRPPNDIALEIASERDPDFAEADDLHRWAMLVQGDEDDIDEWVATHDTARGWAEYLIPAT